MGGLILPKVESRSISPETDSLDRYGQPLDYTYLTGLYLLVNAISDSAAFIDGPDCVMGKAEHVFGKHDLSSTILDCVDNYRIFFSGTDVRNTVVSREEAIGKALLKFKDRPDIQTVFFAAMPMCLLTGTDYVKVSRDVSVELGKSVVHIPSNSLRAFFLDGYAEGLKGLAESLDLSGGLKDKKKVAIVGYFMDRTEDDHYSNLRELKRLVAGVGLELISVWPDGSSVENLRRARDAGWVISLPYAREAARVVAEKTHAKLIELDLPWGIKNSETWVMRLAKAVGDENRAEIFIREEKARISRHIDFLSKNYIQGKKIMIAAEPYALFNLSVLVEELGASVISRVSVGTIPSQIKNIFVNAAKGPALERPTAGLLRRAYAQARDLGVDCVIANGDVRRMVNGEVSFVEVGYPSYFYHSIQGHPFLGFQGCLDFALRLSEEIAQTNTLERPRFLSHQKVLRKSSKIIPFGFKEVFSHLKCSEKKSSDETQKKEELEQEMFKMAPRLEWLIPFVFLNKKFAFFGKQEVFSAIKPLLVELGGEFSSVLIDEPALYAKNRSSWESLSLECDLLVSNFNGIKLLNPQCAFMELDERDLIYEQQSSLVPTMIVIDRMANAVMGKWATPLG